MSSDQSSLDVHLQSVQTRWNEYRARGTFEEFVEFALALNSVTQQLDRLKLPGLLRQCEELENVALGMFGDASSHPVPPEDAVALNRQIEALLQSVEAAQPRASSSKPERRQQPVLPQPNAEWVKPRTVWLVCDGEPEWCPGFGEELSFFGFRVCRLGWTGALPDEVSPLAIVFIPPATGYQEIQLVRIRDLRARHPITQLFCVAVPNVLGVMVELLRAGADVAIQEERQAFTLVGRLMELIQSEEPNGYRVLVVEDSATAVAMIKRSLSQHGIDSRSIGDPQQLLAMMDQYNPDLVLMDMHMPHCTGIEATRALRQLAPYRSLPVVYLSSETDMGMQMEGLRLGGDQFLTKPCNPVFLAGVVKTKIDRYRELQRSNDHDGLTGLLNHSSAKRQLDTLVRTMQPDASRLCVAILSIDHLKAINFTYGHAVGDQVVRSLAWLLKGRLRASDIVGRYGGDELIVALRNAGLDEAQAVLDRIREDFARLPQVTRAGGTLRATFSGGIAAFPAYPTSVGLIQAADDALSEARRLGRNRIEQPMVNAEMGYQELDCIESPAQVQS